MKAQQTRPLIGINADFVSATKTAGAQARINAGYFDSVMAAGGLPVVIPPLVKEADCVKAVSESFLERVFGGSLRPMLAHYVEHETLTAAEIKELKRILDQKD